MGNLIKSKWTPLFTSNFLGVFNDNLLKNSVIFIAVSWVLPAWLNESRLITIVSACMVIPYLFLSPYGGRLAVIYSKKTVFRFFKLIEFPIMLIASLAFYYHWVMLAIVAVLLMGIQSCLYSPSKYGLIRDIGGVEGVSFGSGIFEMMAFLGILIGTVVASYISDLHKGWLVYLLFLGIAVLGYVVTALIRAEETPVKKEDFDQLNPVSFLKESFHFARKFQFLNAAVLGASSFWLIGAMIQMNIVLHSKMIYHASNTDTGMVMAIAAIGIAIGTFLAGKISGHEVKKGLILIGLFVMGIMLFLLGFIHLSFVMYAACVFVTAMMGGFLQVPNLAIIQRSNLDRKLGDMIAYLNLVTFILILFGTLLFWVVTYFTNQNSYAVFISIFVIDVAVMLFFLFKSPEFLSDTLNILRKRKNN